MSVALTALRGCRASFASTGMARAYASKASTAAKASKAKAGKTANIKKRMTTEEYFASLDAAPTDSKMIRLQNILYPAATHHRKQAEPSTPPLSKEKVSEVQTYFDSFAKEGHHTASEAHEAIERIWKLKERQEAQVRRTNIQKKLDRMYEAMEDLRKCHPSHYTAIIEEINTPSNLPVDYAANGASAAAIAAMKKQMHNQRIPGLFPITLKPPVLAKVKGSKGWDYDWKDHTISSKDAVTKSAT